jgi:hypothetical protein
MSDKSHKNIKEDNMSKHSRKPLRYSLACLMGVGLCATSFYPVATLAQNNTAGMMCHAVADNDKRGGSEDMLVKIYADGRVIQVGEGTGTKHMEAISFDLKGEKLYVVAEPAEDGSSDGSRFGTLDLDEDSPTWGQFLPIGNGLGTANGVEGPILIDDVDSLTFDYATQGMVYATLRREHTNPPQYDLLFRIKLTGELDKDAFGPGIDYVPVEIDGYPQYYDVDDIASDPEGGKLYIVANTGDGVESVLATLERGDNKVPTGSATFIGANDVDDIESLDFEKDAQPDGSFRLYGTTGNGGAKKGLDPSAKSRIYLINKETGVASESGKLVFPGQPNRDYEAVSCEPFEQPPGCVMYALHDEGQYHSQLVKIDHSVGGGIGAIEPLGPLYPGLDIEGLAVLPTNGKLYGTSGSDQKKYKGVPIPDGALYEFNRENGLISLIGLTGYSEVSGFALRPTDNTLWGWARGGNRKETTEAGPIIIDPDGTNKDQLGTLVKAFPFQDPDIQAIAWSNDGKKLYGAAPTDDGSDLWAYDYESQKLEVVCSQAVPAEIEGMEMQPDDLLILATHDRKDIGMVAYDPEICDVVATRTFTNVPEYYDVESIEWPAVECQQRSWLYANSGDAEIQLIEHDIVPGDVVDAVCLALGCDDDNNDVTVERDGDTVKVYAGEQVFVARPAIFGGTTRQGMRENSNGCWTVETDVRTMELCPVAVDEVAVANTLPGASVTSEGIVNIDATPICQLDLQWIAPEYPNGQPIPPVTTDQASIAAVGERFLVTWPTRWQQYCDPM